MADESAKALDLTTTAGVKAALAFLEGPWGWVIWPQAKAAMAVFDWLSSPSEVSPEKQAEAAVKIIEAGKQNGAKRVRFKIDKQVGAHLKGNLPVEGARAVVVDAGAGATGTMELEVEYK